jgi:hypothetical protein
MNKTRAFAWIMLIVSAVAASGCIVAVPPRHAMRPYWSHHHHHHWR